MRVTRLTRQGLAYRRFARRMTAAGYEPIAESGAPLWELVRGDRRHCIITDAIIDPRGREVWIKISPANQDAAAHLDNVDVTPEMIAAGIAADPLSCDVDPDDRAEIYTKIYRAMHKARRAVSASLSP